MDVGKSSKIKCLRDFPPTRICGLKVVGSKNIQMVKSNLKPMNHETKAKLKAALVTGYIMLATMSGIAFFGRFIFALITN